MISVLLLEDKTEARVNREDVYTELKRISELLGRDFTQYLKEREGKLYFDANEVSLNPTNWVLIPPYGTRGGIADSPAGFALFFLVVTGLPLTKHQVEWAEFVWQCFRDRVGAIIEASRGFGKTIFTKILMTYLIGLYPDKSNLIMRASTIPAQQTSETIARIISGNEGWKLWFPQIVPESSPGQPGGKWSVTKGYNVVDLSRDPKDWDTMMASRTSPTLIHLGMGSQGVLGSRPTMATLADDLHDEINSASVSELDALVTRFNDVIEPARIPDSRLVIIGTPWSEEDLLQVLPRTGQYRKIKTPITKEGQYPGTPTWPELFNEEEIEKIYKKDTSANKRGFKRNRLLNLEANIDVHFSYRPYPHLDIKPNWPIRMGVDFAAVEKGASVAGRSYFALTVTTQEPKSGSWIIFDGFVGNLTQSQSERMIYDLHDKYEGRVESICIETDGDGRLLVEYLSRQPRKLPIIGEKSGGIPKEVRWERSLEPALAGERILVSDEEHHPYLTQLTRALKLYPNIQKRGDMAADILDSVVWAHYHALTAYADPVRRRKKKDKTPNPWAVLAQME